MRLKTALPIEITRKFRKHSLVLALVAAGLIPNTTQALGLGNISNQSHLGEPLHAQIDLINVPQDLDIANIFIKQVDPKSASEMGVEIVSGWQPLEFEVDASRRHGQITLTSRRAIKEPYINFLLEMKWPNGTLYREYTLFLDPIGLVPARKETVEKITKAPPSTGSSKKAAVKTITYKTQSGDTLNQIAARVTTSTGMAKRQIVEWIYKHNPHAFGSGGIDYLMADVTLALPGQISEPTKPAEHALAKVEANAEPPADSSAARPEGRLVLSTPVRLGATPSQTEQLRANIALNNLALEQLTKENRDLRERLDFIENSGYIAKLEKLLVAQQEELALLRGKLQSRTANALAEFETAATTPLAKQLEQAPAYLWGLALACLTVLCSFVYAIARLRFKHLYQFEKPESPHADLDTQYSLADALEPEAPQAVILPTIKQDKKVREAVAEEARKVQLISQQIRLKTGDYHEKTHPASNDMHLVEEIPIDPELEAYLKIK